MPLRRGQAPLGVTIRMGAEGFTLRSPDGFVNLAPMTNSKRR